MANVLHWVSIAIVIGKRWAVEMPRHFTTLYFIRERRQLSSALGSWHLKFHYDARAYPNGENRDGAPWFHKIYPSINANHNNETIL